MTKLIITVRRSAMLLAATGAFVAAPAAAERVVVTGNPAPSATVSIADLNLGSPAGMARLKSRIEATAADLCLTTAVEPVGTRMARSKCYRAAVASGNRQVDQLAAGWNGKSATAAAALTISAR